MARLVSLEAVKNGSVSLRDILVLNQLLDADNYQRSIEQQEAENK